MKKIFGLAIIILVSFIVPSFKVEATSNLYISGDKAYLFPQANEYPDKIDVLLQGQNYEIMSKVPAGNGCLKEWYQIKHNSNIGYVCGEWVQTQELTYNNEDANFQATLDTFPKTYWPYLINLHKTYPNATFVPQNTNLDWAFALQKQTNTCYLGANNLYSCKSLIQIKKSAISDWGSKYILNANTNNSGGGCGDYYCWYAASEEAVSTYMDPRNFLNPIFVFMFESNEYDESFQNITGLNKIIAGTFMDGNNSNYSKYKLEDNKLYADEIMLAAKSSLISPYTISARIRQEIGGNGSTIISGTVPGYEGYYNYFNIDATGGDPIGQGLQYAKTNSWDTRIKAINGGANFLAAGYKGTEYTNKWDVLGSDYTNYSDFFKSQYMQNIQAPASQTYTIYETYRDTGLLNIPFTFNIPVYQNMPNSKTEIVYAIELAGYKTGDDYITNIKTGSTLSTITNNIKVSNNKLTVSVKSADGSKTLVDSDSLGTGNVISISNGTTTENYRLIIKGDTNGDGAINAVDYVSVRNQIMGSGSLSSYYRIAADIDKNNSISSIDYINIRNYIMGNPNLIN